jgi:hypothetical protein
MSAALRTRTFINLACVCRCHAAACARAVRRAQPIFLR